MRGIAIFSRLLGLQSIFSTIKKIKRLKVAILFFSLIMAHLEPSTISTILALALQVVVWNYFLSQQNKKISIYLNL
ncbi:MAG: hypothetical protein C0605_03220 [Hyphomicrobiales bacterium]|nr:MAG: hypothetical protein C0605_03220 [Hyphomicrobiales bacterium]